MQVDICIATFNRPRLLNILLQSLAMQRFNSDVMVRVIIIDNDPEQSARNIVENHISEFPFHIYYESEPKRGITYARNKALSCVRGDYFAFVDDDEYVDPIWLQSLLNTISAYNADAVFGPVIGVLNENAPTWSKSHPSFSRKRRSTGMRMTNGGAGNVLIRTSSIGEPRALFNNAFALTGGEDTEYFYRLFTSGKSLVWCDEALAYEYVSEDRLTTKWVYRRAYRSGQTIARVHCINKSYAYRAMQVIRKLTQLVVWCLLLPVVRIISYPVFVRMLTRLNGVIGHLSVNLGGNKFYCEYSGAGCQHN